jgi:signal transduction histidine kinase/ActR/RegA family two-component response regulator
VTPQEPGRQSDTIEQRIGMVRLVMLVSSTLIFPIWFHDRPGCVPWLGYTELVVGWCYALTILWSHRVQTWVGGDPSPITAVADTVFAIGWIHATGGQSSPYYVILALAVVAVSLRFTVRETLVAASANGIAYVALLAYRGELWANLGDTTVRIVYLGISAMLGALVVSAITVEAEAKAQAREQALAERLKERLYLSDRLASLGSLAASVAHEINNPLTFVLGNLDHVESSVKGRRDLGELAGVVAETREGADRIRHIVRELSRFSRPLDDDAAPVAVQVREALRLAVAMAQGQIRHRARLVENYAVLLPPVVASPTPLGQVFLNLLVNAAQAIEPGHVDDNEITIRTDVGPDGTVLVEITDTGTGIPPEIREQIFDPFFTTKIPGTGTGLGLAISKQIVADLGGTLTLGPNGARGTVARVSLPIATDDITERSRAVGATPSVEPGRGARILIVDDETLLCQALQRSLGRAHDVVTCTDGRDALRLLAAGDRFDLVLCDVMMPSMTGMEFHDAVRASDEALARRIVFMTGGTFTDEARAFLDAVPNAVLHKPFGVDVVERILAGVDGGEAAVSS